MYEVIVKWRVTAFRQSMFHNKIPCLKSHIYNNLYNKRVRPTKKEPQQQGISYLEREREGVRREREGQVGR